MFDRSKFPDSASFYLFHLALLLMMAAEVFIVFYTHPKDRSMEKVNKRDKGTKWLLIINFYVCIYLSFLMVSHNGWDYALNTKLPVVVSYPGIGLMLAGMACYSARIFVEEDALKTHFGNEFAEYEKRTYRLIPYLF